MLYRYRNGKFRDCYGLELDRDIGAKKTPKIRGRPSFRGKHRGGVIGLRPLGTSISIVSDVYQSINLTSKTKFYKHQPQKLHEEISKKLKNPKKKLRN